MQVLSSAIGMGRDQRLTSHWRLSALPKTMVALLASCAEKCLRAKTLLLKITFQIDGINLFISLLI